MPRRTSEARWTDWYVQHGEPPFSSIQSLSFSFSLLLSLLCSPRDFLKSLFQARPRTGRGARPAFLPSDTNASKFESSTEQCESTARRAREKYFKKERAFLVIVSSQPGYSNLAKLLPGKLDPVQSLRRRSCTLITHARRRGLVKVRESIDISRYIEAEEKGKKWKKKKTDCEEEAWNNKGNYRHRQLYVANRIRDWLIVDVWRTDEIRRAKQVTRVDWIARNECKLIRAKNSQCYFYVTCYTDKFCFDLKVVPFREGVLVGRYRSRDHWRPFWRTSFSPRSFD